jgi:hypothetical protein
VGSQALSQSLRLRKIDLGGSVKLSAAVSCLLAAASSPWSSSKLRMIAWRWRSARVAEIGSATGSTAVLLVIVQLPAPVLARLFTCQTMVQDV